MEEVKKGFNVKNIVLLNCTFERALNIDFETLNNSRNHLISIDVSTQIDKNIINVVDTLDFKIEIDGNIYMEARICMLGVFEKIGDTAIMDEKLFGDTNGAAIVYPFIREHLSNLCLKASLGQIMLPTVNFIELNKRKVKDTEDK